MNAPWAFANRETAWRVLARVLTGKFLIDHRSVGGGDPGNMHRAGEGTRCATVEVRIRDLGQLFNSLDPSPFQERDLDVDAEEYIVGWAREVDAKGPFRIVVHLPESEAARAQERGLEAAIGHYFDYRAGMLERDLHDLLRVGRRSLGIGVGVLAVFIALAQIIRTMLPGWPLSQLLAEGLTIFGWVANWRPAEIFFYDIWAVRRRLHLYRRLAAAEVALKTF